MVSLMIVFGFLFLSANAQDSCLPELLREGKAKLEFNSLKMDPCPLSVDSSLLEAAVNEYFTPGIDIPRECTVNVTEVKRCKSKEKKMRGRQTMDSTEYNVDVDVYVQINCTTDPCNGAGFIIDQENGTSILLDEHERISSLTLDNLDDSTGKGSKKSKSKKSRAGKKKSAMIEVDGQTYDTEGKIKVYSKYVYAAACGDRVVGKIDIRYLSSPNTATATTTKRGKQRKSKKNKPDGEFIIANFLCGMYI